MMMNHELMMMVMISIRIESRLFSVSCAASACRSCSVNARATPVATAVNAAVQSSTKFHGSRAPTPRHLSAKV